MLGGQIEIAKPTAPSVPTPGTLSARSKNLAGAEVEEINLKFGMKIGGKAGLPIFTEGTAESNFEVSVKCKFPSASPNTP